MQLNTITAYESLAGKDALTPAEITLIAACRAGQPCRLGDGTRPEKPSPARQIRADLLRLLITGGSTDCRLAEDGVVLLGGWINGLLVLQFAHARGQTVLRACNFTHEPDFTQANLLSLDLTDGLVPGIFAQELKVTGSAMLNGLVSTACVDFTGARIGGKLSLQGARLLRTDTQDGKAGMAFNAHGIYLAKDLLLNGLVANGTVNVAGAEIRGEMTLHGAKLAGTLAPGGKPSKAFNAQGATIAKDLSFQNIVAKGTVNVTGAQIFGQMICDGAAFSGIKDPTGNVSDAFTAQTLVVAKWFRWNSIQIEQGQVNFASARVGDLVDEIASWPNDPNQLISNGFTYDRISGDARTDAASRFIWLRTASTGKDTFHPQPYTQLARVLSEMGHERSARRILMERETRHARHQWKKDKAHYAALRSGGAQQHGDIGFHWMRMWSSRLWSALIRRIAGYGYAPARALYWTCAFLVFGTVFYFLAWRLGAMVPNSAIILTSSDWAAAMALNPVTPATAWTGLPTAAHYETFYALPYAADVFVPLVDFGQQSAWSQTTVTWSGWVARIVTWGMQVTGWVITALGAAAVTGIIKRDRD